MLQSLRTGPWLELKVSQITLINIMREKKKKVEIEAFHVY